MARGVNRGEIWGYRFRSPDKWRPVLILSRQNVIRLLRTVMAAPITSAQRGAPSEVRVGVEEGLKKDSAVNLDHVQTIEKDRLERFLGLAARLLPALVRAQDKAKRTYCLNSLRQIGLYVQFYTDDNRDIFPAHRNQNEGDNATTALTNWWGTAVINYARNQSNLFCCPAIRGKRLDNGVTWEWKFDCHKVGYGINSWFLSLWPYTGDSRTVGGIRFDVRPWFKRTNVRSPVDNFLIGDSKPKVDGYWSSSCYWPWSCMDPQNTQFGGFEGIDQNRHRNTGVVVFTDGHSEARKGVQINPPRDPGFGDAQGFVNSRYWDPLKRGGER